MLVSFLYLLARRILELIVLRFRSGDAKTSKSLCCVTSSPSCVARSIGPS